MVMLLMNAKVLLMPWKLVDQAFQSFQCISTTIGTRIIIFHNTAEFIIVSSKTRWDNIAMDCWACFSLRTLSVFQKSKHCNGLLGLLLFEDPIGFPKIAALQWTVGPVFVWGPYRFSENRTLLVLIPVRILSNTCSRRSWGWHCPK